MTPLNIADWVIRASRAMLLFGIRNVDFLGALAFRAWLAFTGVLESCPKLQILLLASLTHNTAYKSVKMRISLTP